MLLPLLPVFSHLVHFLTLGHYNLPLIPYIRGIETFPQDKITHAKYFRHPSTYTEKKVLLVGNGASSSDLGNQLVNYAQSVQRSVRSEPNSLSVVDPKVRDIPSIRRFTSDTIELIDGAKLTDIDAVIFCTGYLYSLPMFPKEAGFITSDGFYVHRLYQQTFYTEDPSLVFMGLPKQVIPFPTFQNQAIALVKVWAQKLFLPSREIMRKEELTRLEQKKFDMAKYHSFPHPEDIELAENWRHWIEKDKSNGWEKSMKPWHWTEERVKYRSATIDIKKLFLREIEEHKWDHFWLQGP
jgi:hypothetical protein